MYLIDVFTALDSAYQYHYICTYMFVYILHVHAMLVPKPDALGNVGRI